MHRTAAAALLLLGAACDPAPRTLAGATSPHSLVVTGEHVVFADGGAELPLSISRVPLGGGPVEVLRSFPAGLSRREVALGQDAEHVLLASCRDGTVSRWPKRGTGWTVIATGLHCPGALAIARGEQHVLDLAGLHVVPSAGGEPVRVWAPPPEPGLDPLPRHLATDGSTLAWTDQRSGVIWVWPAGGAAPRRLTTGQLHVEDLVVAGGAVTWLVWRDEHAPPQRTADGRIVRAPVGGGPLETLAGGLRWPTRLEILEGELLFATAPRPTGLSPRERSGGIYRLPAGGGKPKLVIGEDAGATDVVVAGGRLVWSAPADDGVTAGQGAIRWRPLR